MKAGMYSLDEGEGECLVTWKHGYIMSCQLLHRYAQHQESIMNSCQHTHDEFVWLFYYTVH